MAGLTAALYAANTSLYVNSRDLDVVSRNIANVETPGYTKKVFSRSSIVYGSQGGGVYGDGVDRFVPVELLRQSRFQNSVTTSLEQTSVSLSRVEVAFGNPSDENSIGALLGELEDAFRQAALEPEDNLLHLQVLQTAQRFTEELNQMTDLIQEERRQAELSIEETVDTVNELVSDIHLLSDQIVLVQAGNGDASDLKDKRDALVNSLSEEIDISYYEETNGRMIISLTDGKTLLEKQPFELTFTRRNVTPQSYYDPAIPAPGAGSGLLGGIILDVPDGGPDIDVTSSFSGGKLGGLIEVRDEILPQAQAQLDELATNLMVRFGAIRDVNADAPLDRSIYELFVDPGDTALGIPLGSATAYADAAVAGNALPPPAFNEFDFGAAGLVDNQDVGLAGRIQVNASFLNNQYLVRQGTFFLDAGEGNPDPVTGDPQFLESDGSLIQRVIDEVFLASSTDMSNAALFGAGGPAQFGYRTSGVGANDGLSTRLENRSSVESYTNSIVAFQANQLDGINQRLDSESYIQEQVDNELLGTTGVNIDQELARLIEIEAAYTASSQIITTIRQLFDDLLSVV